MLTLIRRQSLIASRMPERVERWVMNAGGMRLSALLEAHRDPAWPADLELTAWVDGVRLEGSGLARAVRDTDQLVVFGPAVQDVGTIAIQLVATVAVQYATNRLLAKLFPIKKGQTAKPDEQTPTFGWNGLETTQGDGYYTPLVVGRTRVAGHRISTDISPLGSGELASVVLEVGFGPFHSIGGITRDTDNESVFRDTSPLAPQNPNPNFPAGIQINDIPLEGETADVINARVSIRLGTLDQFPMSGGFDRPSATVNVGQELAEFDDAVVIVIPDVKARRIRVQIDGEALYRQDQNGNYYPHLLELEIKWRARGTQTWSVPIVLRIYDAIRQPYSRTPEFDVAPFDPGGSGFDGYEVHVRRRTSRTPNDNWFYSDLVVVTRAVYHAGFGQSLPEIALVALALEANGQLSGGDVRASVPADGHLVRVFDDDLGLSDEEHWDFPTDDYAGIWTNVPPGRNPAWQAGYLHTHPDALGAQRLEPIWHLFRDWADFCDEMELASAYVFDTPNPGLLHLAETIYQAGRAIPVVVGNQVFPVYWYRDGHGRGENSVLPKLPMGALCAANVLQWTIRYHPKQNRITRYAATIRDETQNFELKPVHLDRPDINTTDPTKLDFETTREEDYKLAAVTSPVQAKRHLWFIDQQTTLADRSLEAQCWADKVYWRVGENFRFQARKYVPHADSPNIGARIGEDLDETAYIVVDQEVTFDEAGTYRCTIDVPGMIVHTILDVAAQSYAKGDHIPLMSPLTLPEGVTRDAPVIIGALDDDPDTGEPKPAGQEFTCVDIRIVNDKLVQVSAVLFVPEAFDEPPGEILSGFDLDEPSQPLVQPIGAQLGDLGEELAGRNVRVSRDCGGCYRIDWTMPAGYLGRPAFVQSRVPGEPWRSLGTSATGSLTVPALADLPDLEIRVSPRIDELGMAAPTTLSTTMRIPEFSADPVGSPANFRATALGDRLLLQWDPVAGVERYEVRRGRHWDGAAVVAVTQDPRFVVRDAPAGEVTYHVKATAPFRGWSRTAASVTVDWPGSEAEQVDAVTVGADDIEAEADHLVILGDPFGAELLADHYHASITISVNGDPDAPTLWMAEVDYHEELVAGMEHELNQIPLGDGEGEWRGALTREPSSRYPGVDLLLTLDDLDDDMTRPLVTGVGRNTIVTIEARFFTDDWSEWAPFEPHVRTAETMELRVTAYRRSKDYQIRLEAIRAQCVATAAPVEEPPAPEPEPIVLYDDHMIGAPWIDWAVLNTGSNSGGYTSSLLYSTASTGPGVWRVTAGDSGSGVAFIGQSNIVAWPVRPGLVFEWTAALLPATDDRLWFGLARISTAAPPTDPDEVDVGRYLCVLIDMSKGGVPHLLASDNDGFQDVEGTDAAPVFVESVWRMEVLADTVDLYMDNALVATADSAIPYITVDRDLDMGWFFGVQANGGAWGVIDSDHLRVTHLEP